MSPHFASADTGERTTGPESGSPETTTTPLFAANHADRYQRQTLITRIQDRYKRLLICYVSGDRCIVDEHDTKPFVDLLHKAPPDRSLDLLLHTTGGSIDAAEKLMGMLRRHVGSATLRIIVPEFAKSAGTLMVLGADSAVMSDMSELGPIDPQARLFDRWQSVQSYLDAYSVHANALKADRDDIVAQIMLGKLDPATLRSCESAVKRARQAAENLLKRGMFRDGGNWTSTVTELLDTGRWLSHGQMLSWEDACDPQIGLVVQHLPYRSKEWQDYWRLYCLQSLAIADRQKLYESASVSLVIGPTEAT